MEFSEYDLNILQAKLLKQSLSGNLLARMWYRAMKGASDNNEREIVANALRESLESLPAQIESLAAEFVREQGET